MGTPEFAVASLDTLVQAGCHIVAVITAPDKPAGRGMELRQSAVKKYALQKNLLVLQPEKLKNPTFLNELKQLDADLQICVAFRMLPEVVWNMPAMGTINLHGSLLPQYPGAAPINWAVINGETETGVTTFKLKHEIDTGNILMQKHFAVAEKDTAGSVHDKMMHIGATLLLTTVQGIANNSLQEKPQIIPSHEMIKLAPKIFTETCHIDATQTTECIYNLVRGLSPHPAAFTFINGKKLKIFQCKPLLQEPHTTPGTFDTDGKTYLNVACSNGYLQLLEVQLEGKRRMNIEEFLRGYRI